MTDMNPQDIQAEIRKRGGTLAAIARGIQVDRQVLSLALRARVSERADEAIAEFLGLPAFKIWPSRYDKHGNRIRLKASAAA